MEVSSVPEVGAARRGYAVSLGVETAADLHRIARLPLVRVVVCRRLYQESVFALAYTRYSFFVG